MLEKKKTSINILVNHKVRFLKRRKAKSVNMTINDIKIVYFFSCVSIKLSAGFINKKKNKEKLVKRYQYLSEEEKNKKDQYTCETHSNLSEEEENKNHQLGRKSYK